jgi:hypothetical protein
VTVTELPGTKSLLVALQALSLATGFCADNTVTDRRSALLSVAQADSRIPALFSGI